MELSEIHNCKKCQGKIVKVTIDKLGITRCGYCNQVVDYKPYLNSIKVPEYDKIQEAIKKLRKLR